MRNILKNISVFSYVVAVLYIADTVVQCGYISKNHMYILIVFPITMIGVGLLNIFFNKFNKKNNYISKTVSRLGIYLNLLTPLFRKLISEDRNILI